MASVWDQIDALKDEHETTKKRINAKSDWRFRGRKPNGDWMARRRQRRDPETGAIIKAKVDLREPTSAALLAAVARTDGLCPKCFHSLRRCGPDGCSALLVTLPVIETREPAKNVATGTVKKPERPRCGCTENKAPAGA